MLSYSLWVPINLTNAHCFSKLNLTTSLYEFPLMLKTTRPFFNILAFGYVFLISCGFLQFELIVVLYHVFRYCSESACFSQNFLNVLFANILFI